MRVLITPREHIWPEITDEQIDGMKAAGASEVVVARDRQAELDEIRNADVFVGSLDPELFERAGRLRWVQSLSSGVDAMLFPEFVASDVVLTSEKGLVGSHLADHAFALLLSLTRSIGWAVRQRQRRWDNRLPMRRANRELTGLAIGIIGLGGTGTAVAERAAAFGMTARAVDPDVTEKLDLVDELTTPDRLVDMATRSDVLAVCCPLTRETRNMVDARVLNAMRPGGYVVNVTRGGIIDENALVEAVESGHLAGAGLDVTAEEPLPDDSPLWSSDRIVITPHTAGASQYRISRVHGRVCRNLIHLANGEPLEGVISKQKGY